MRGSCLTALTALLCLPVFVGASRAERNIRDPGTYVVDEARVIDTQERSQLERWLKELEQKTTAQVKVLTILGTDGEDFFDFVQRHYELWRLGQKGKDNGALIAFDLGGRHIRIHTGYGLEGVLPDSWCGSLSREIAEKYFRRHAYSQGLYRLTLAVANQVANDAGVKLTGMPEVHFSEPRAQIPGWLTWTIFAIVLIVLFLGWRTRGDNRRRRSSMPWGPVYGNGWGSGYGGGFGGGWGGAGGGIGGGSFGGGGHSGGGGGGATWCHRHAGALERNQSCKFA